MPAPTDAVIDRKTRPIYDALNRGDSKVCTPWWGTAPFTDLISRFSRMQQHASSIARQAHLCAAARLCMHKAGRAASRHGFACLFGSSAEQV